jgi:DNA-binding transcriptional MerR regulator
MRNGVQIGRVAEQTGLSVDAIRFYEKQRLLDRPPRTEGGFRIFGREDIERIRFIRSVQQLGFSLPEIRELVVLRRDHGEACSHVRELLLGKLGTVREKVRELRALERQLVRSLQKCEANRKSEGACVEDECPVLKDATKGGLDEN